MRRLPLEPLNPPLPSFNLSRANLEEKHLVVVVESVVGLEQRREARPLHLPHHHVWWAQPECSSQTV